MEKELEGYVPQDTFSAILTTIMNVLYHQRSAGIEEMTKLIQAKAPSDPRSVGESLLDLIKSDGGIPGNGPVDFVSEWSQVLRLALRLPDGTPPQLQEVVEEILELSAKESPADEQRLAQAYEAACRLLKAEPIDD